MWSFIQRRLTLRGSVPDKASIDYRQAREIYAVLHAEEMLFREMAQIAILKWETDAIKNLAATS
ncbi:MAG: hypothetical protein KGI33_11270 [Thaumarchaeota archaeon]|nr:hypothetical protein [Nitrososphaerota archaeon]